MKIIKTSEVFDEYNNTRKRTLDAMERLYIYNGLDTSITREVFDEIYPQLDSTTKIIYNFELCQRAPALEMMQRGIRIDKNKRYKLLKQAQEDAERVDRYLQALAEAAWDKGINYASYPQVMALLYNWIGLPVQYIWDSKKREMRPSANRESLEKLLIYLTATPIVSCILWLRENKKRMEVMEARLDEDGRFRTSFNVGATENGRWSSSKSVFGTGGNLQNIEHESRPGMGDRAIRSQFVASEGYKLAYSDLEQAESREVAYLSGDDNYIKAHNESDPHTIVAGLCFSLNLTGNPKEDREKAEQPYYRHFSYRDLSKRGGHATNYFAKPHTIARHLKINEEIASEFQRSYFGAFPGIRLWHRHIIQLIQTRGFIISPLGRKRHFLARRDDDETIKEAIASQPQSLVADILNEGLIRVYELYLEGLPIRLLQNGYDAILYEFPEGKDQEVIPVVENALRIPHMVQDIHGVEREVVIPVDTKTGYDWHNLKSWRSNLRAERKPLDLLGSHAAAY